MDLSARIADLAFAHPAAFVLAWPGVTALRWEVEKELRERGWPTAASPADTDVLLILAPGDLLGADAVDIIERFWAQMPEPRARRLLTPGVAVTPALDQARAEVRHRAVTAAPQPTPLTVTPDHGDHGPSEGAGDSHGHGDGDGDAHGLGQGHSQDHGGGDGDGDMMMPAGRPLAEEASDRDGLALDVLHLGLGPALAWWPAGVQLRLAVQGDVVQEAVVSVLARHPEVGRCEPDTVALDVVRRVLFVAGADRLALRAERLRERLHATGTLDGARDPVLVMQVRRFAAAVRRGRVLAAMLRRIPVADGDVWVRMGWWLDVAAGTLGASGADSTDPGRRAVMFVGRELAEVQLIAAVLDWSPARVSVDG